MHHALLLLSIILFSNFLAVVASMDDETFFGRTVFVMNLVSGVLTAAVMVLS